MQQSEKIAQIICEYLEANVVDSSGIALPFPIEIEMFRSKDRDGAIIRHDPTSAAERRFIDGTRLVVRVFSVYTRCKDTFDALKWSRLLIDTIDGKEIEKDALKVECVAQSLPQFIEQDAGGYTVYMGSFSAKYMEE